MLHLRRSPIGASIGSSNGDDRKTGTAESRQQSLRRCALAFAFGVPILEIVPVIVGFRLSVILWLLVIPGFIGMWAVNRVTVGRLTGTRPAPMVLAFRVVIALGGSLVVALAATLWTFDAAIEAERAPSGSAGPSADVRTLEIDRQQSLDVLAQRLPMEADDPEVVRLGRALVDTSAKLDEAKREAICELDGTCGTGVSGKGFAYYEKVGYRDQLQRAVDALPQQLAGARRAVADQAARLGENQQKARGRVADIDKQLAALRAPSAPRPNRLTAFLRVADEKPILVALSSIGFSVLLFTADCLAFLFVVHRICRRPDDLRMPDRDSVKAQHEQDEIRSQGAVAYESLPPGIRDGMTGGSS
ncbi:DUF4407 domain-containing protein [Amycolatopsis sp. NPDC026612]|uniref:DUF4407 domain-containing protein n=1 Tax=Amycolatopsis sp. NPDC026612 TaxID=3155466 RepID=UPI003403B583